MILAAHQAHYMPWLGYLHKVMRADLFVVMDDLQYEAQNFQNRNRIKVNNGTIWLTVPLVKGHQADRICDKQINNTQQAKECWRRRTWATLTTHYGRAPFFERYAPELSYVYERSWSSLLELDLKMLELMMRWLGITTPIVLASTLGATGEKSDRILQVCQRAGANVYLSGAGASSGYLDVELFRRHGMDVAWQDFTHPVYPQRYPTLGFVPRLSALDLIFNCGPESRDVLESSEVKDEPVLCSGGAERAGDWSASG
jgi:hypothetical protein